MKLWRLKQWDEQNDFFLKDNFYTTENRKACEIVDF